MAKVVFSFDDKSAKKLKNKKNILGGKGANLGEMGRLGLPVPPRIFFLLFSFFADLSSKLNTTFSITILLILKNR